MKMPRWGSCKFLRAFLTREDTAAYNGNKEVVCMKKLMICLLVMLCMIPAAHAAEDCPIEFQMELSQTLLDGPAEVDVTIVLTNASGEDMPGPLALYAPDGVIIKEFGMPTLLAGESQTWRGTWNVTQEQINGGKVIFAVKYTWQDAAGKQQLKTQAFFLPIWQCDIVLKGNPSTGYSWQCDAANGDAFVKVVSQYRLDWQPDGDNDIPPPGTAGRYFFALNGVAAGEETLTFTYKRIWEDAEPLYTLVYHVRVDENLNVTILSSSFDW